MMIFENVEKSKVAWPEASRRRFPVENSISFLPKGARHWLDITGVCIVINAGRNEFMQALRRMHTHAYSALAILQTKNQLCGQIHVFHSGIFFLRLIRLYESSGRKPG